MLKEKEALTIEDLDILEIFEDPVLFGEFIRSGEAEDDNKFFFNNYQKRMLLDESTFIVVCTGRATGKTLSLETKIMWLTALNKYGEFAPDNEVTLVVQNKSQLDPVFRRISTFFRTNHFLKHFIDNKFGINKSEYLIQLKNGGCIRCRIIGQAGDSNVVGLHTPCILVDEAQLANYEAWLSLQQCFNSWIEGCQLWVSGVPKGLRERNVLFECDQLMSEATEDNDMVFSKHNLSRLESPRYTKSQHIQDLKRYGGVEGENYKHLVLGEHGTPAFSVFDRAMMRIERYQVHTAIMNAAQLQNAGGEFHKLLTAPDIPKNLNPNLVALSIDAGYSNDPSIFIVLYQSDGIWREHARYELRRIKYPTQAKIIKYLDNIYRFNMITMDAGSSGLAVGQFLQEEGEYKIENYEKRLIMVDFQGTVITGYDEDGKEIKDRVKRFTIQQLQQWAQSDQIIAFSEYDVEVINELERVGFTRDMLGHPKFFVYSDSGSKQGGDDHILASLLTWVYGFYYEYYSPVRPNKRGKFSDLAMGGTGSNYLGKNIYQR